MVRPYQINPPNGEWVDLRTVQSITPPVLHDNAFDPTAYLEWRHAFQSGSRVVKFHGVITRDEMQSVIDSYKAAGKVGPSDTANIHKEFYTLRVQRAMAKAQAEFDRFFNAWAGTRFTPEELKQMNDDIRG